MIVLRLPLPSKLNCPLDPVVVFWAEEMLAPSARSETSSGEHSDPRQTTRPSRLALIGWKLMFRTGESTMVMSCFSGANPMFVYEWVYKEVVDEILCFNYQLC